MQHPNLKLKNIFEKTYKVKKPSSTTGIVYISGSFISCFRFVIINEKTGERTRMKAIQNIVFWWFKHPDTRAGKTDTLLRGKMDTEFIDLFYFLYQ